MSGETQPTTSAAGEHRLIYYVTDTEVVVIGVGGHYGTNNSPNAYTLNLNSTDSVFDGEPLEAAVHYFTTQLQNQPLAIAVPATFGYTATGIDSWPYWRDQLAAAWPIIAWSLGA